MQSNEKKPREHIKEMSTRVSALQEFATSLRGSI